MDENRIVLINKPSGVTSFRVTGMVKRALGIKKAGHAGTLDPLASGVLPVFCGRATKLIDILPSERKRYTATFMLGMTTDTLDNEGEVQTEQPVRCTEDEIAAAVSRFSGEITQIPPMYSAIKKDGVKLYDLARRGIETERKARKIMIYSIALTELRRVDDTFVGTIDVACSKGTYIRTLIDDIGMALGCGAFMTGLVRTEGSGFTLDECIDPDELKSAADPNKLTLPADAALRGYDALNVSDAQATRFANGGEINTDRINTNVSVADGERYRVYNNNKFIGLGIAKGGAVHPEVVF